MLTFYPESNHFSGKTHSNDQSFTHHSKLRHDANGTSEKFNLPEINSRDNSFQKSFLKDNALDSPAEK